MDGAHKTSRSNKSEIQIGTSLQQNMSKQNRMLRKYIFKKDQIVWAKLRGFPNWPAKVI